MNFEGEMLGGEGGRCERRPKFSNADFAKFLE